MKIKNTKAFLEYCKEIGITEIASKTPTIKYKTKNFEAEAKINNFDISDDLKEKRISKVEKKFVSEKKILLKKLIDDISKLNSNLKDTSTSTVFSDGNIFSKIMIIGEMPGTEEDKCGVPFQGKSGELLYEMLANFGLNKKNLYLTNLIFWRPPGNRMPKKSEINSCLPFTLKHIEIINPKLIIFLGGLVAKTILKIPESIIELRGKEKLLEINKQKIMTYTIFHPNFLIENPNEKKQTWFDLTKYHEKFKKITENEK